MTFSHSHTHTHTLHALSACNSGGTTCKQPRDTRSPAAAGTRWKLCTDEEQICWKDFGSLNVSPEWKVCHRSFNQSQKSFSACLLLDGKASVLQQGVLLRRPEEHTCVQIQIRHFGRGRLPSAAVFVFVRQLTASLEGRCGQTNRTGRIREFTVLDCTLLWRLPACFISCFRWITSLI